MAALGAALLLLYGSAPALDNGIVHPPMGFSTWNHFGAANCTRKGCGVVNLTGASCPDRAGSPERRPARWSSWR